MTDRSVAYDTIAHRYDETRGGYERGSSFARAFADGLGAVDGAVLDVGVGTAAVAWPLRELGYSVVGVDLSLPMLARAFGRLGPSVAQGDGYHLPVRDGAMVGVVMSWLLQLVPDQTALLAECRRVLRPDGRVVAIVAQPVEREPCDMTPMQEEVVIRTGGVPVAARLGHAVAAAERAGFTVLRQTETEAQAFDESPAYIVGLLRDRLAGYLIHLTDAEFDELVQPSIDALLDLPEPERPRRRVHAHPLLVLT